VTPRLLWLVIDLHLEDREKDGKPEEERDDYTSIKASFSLFFVSLALISSSILPVVWRTVVWSGALLSFVSETVAITLSCEGSIHSS